MVCNLGSSLKQAVRLSKLILFFCSKWSNVNDKARYCDYCTAIKIELDHSYPIKIPLSWYKIPESGELGQ